MKKNYNLLKLRLENGLSQTAMAKRLGVSVQVYNYVENKKRQGSRDFWITVARVFNLPASSAWDMWIEAGCDDYEI